MDSQPVSQVDRWRAAQQLVKLHGDYAGYQAGMNAGDLLKKGDRVGFDFWMDIAFKIAQLQNLSASIRLN